MLNKISKLSQNEQNFLRSKLGANVVVTMVQFFSGKTKVQIEGKGNYFLIEDWAGDITAKKA